MNAPAEAPKTTETKEDSALTAFMKTLDPKAKPNTSDKKAAAAKFKAFQAKKAAALKALTDLESEEQEMAKEALKAFGKTRLTVDGVDYTPTSRGERIYYKTMTTKGVEI